MPVKPKKVIAVGTDHLSMNSPSMGTRTSGPYIGECATGSVV